MITQELFEKYNQFQREFYKTSEHITDILKKKWYDDSEDFSNFHFSNDNENVCFTRSLGFNQYTDGKFPSELLFMTDEEINKWIDDKIKKDRILEERRAKAEKLRLQKNAEKEARRIRKKDLAEYERIKKKYNLD